MFVVRNRASLPLRMIQLEGSVVVEREICNLSSPTAIRIPALTLPSSTLVQMERSRQSFLLRFSVAFRFFLNNTIPNTLVDNCSE